jgi:FO synthase
VRDFLRELIAAGLGSLPGTAAEILDDEVRQVICPDKVTTAEWLSVMATAHELGCAPPSPSCSGTWKDRALGATPCTHPRAAARTGGFTEFVPLPFVHMEAPVYRRGQARKGPTSREAILMHAVARLALNPVIRTSRYRG